MFPLLTALAANGKQKQWSVEVIQDTDVLLQVTHGYVGGKLVTTSRVVTAGKNVGKRNATTPLEQAQCEARSLWNKKKDAGYAEAMEGIEEATMVVPPPRPMLALPFTVAHKRLSFPCYAQRKLDGVRCLAIPGKGLFSRNGK